MCYPIKNNYINIMNARLCDIRPQNYLKAINVKIVQSSCNFFSENIKISER